MDKKESKSKKGTMPYHTVRHGAVAANIWERQSQTGFTYYEYSLSRSWKSSNSGKEGYSQNYYSRNQEQIIACIQDATKFIDELMAEHSASETQAKEPQQPMPNGADVVQPAA